MGFLSGPVSFSRFSVVGGSPKRLDDRCLDHFRAHLAGASRVARSDDEETGWIGGRHLLDREFDVEKNVLLDCLHFGMRIDSSRVPPDLLYAYTQQELEALSKNNGHSSAKERATIKKQAVEAARGRARQEVKEGRYRAQRQVPILWDTREDVMFVGATQPAVFERLAPLFRKSFDKRLEPLGAGAFAYRWGERQGAARKIESLKPAKFVAHPSGNGHIDVYWTAQDPANRDFLGNEFLLWMWYVLAEQNDTIELPDASSAAVIIVKQLMLECPWGESGKELISCEGPAQLPESRRAIHTGKLPRKAGLIVSRGGDQYEFTLQAERLSISSAKLPPLEPNGNPRAYLEERVEQVRELSTTVDQLFEAFLTIRVAAEWPDTRERIIAWLKSL